MLDRRIPLDGCSVDRAAPMTWQSALERHALATPGDQQTRLNTPFLFKHTQTQTNTHTRTHTDICLIKRSSQTLHVYDSLRLDNFFREVRRDPSPSQPRPAEPGHPPLCFQVDTSLKPKGGGGGHLSEGPWGGSGVLHHMCVHAVCMEIRNFTLRNSYLFLKQGRTISELTYFPNASVEVELQAVCCSVCAEVFMRLRT